VSLHGILILAKEALEEVIHETEDLVIIFSGGGLTVQVNSKGKIKVTF
jgi:hypothetical protein